MVSDTITDLNCCGVNGWMFDSAVFASTLCLDLCPTKVATRPGVLLAIWTSFGPVPTTLLSSGAAFNLLCTPVLPFSDCHSEIGCL